MEIQGSIAIVTGANRGMGRHFARQLLERGAAKVYAGSRRIESVDLPGVEAHKSDPADIVRIGLDGIESGALEVLADRATADIKATLNADPGVVYPGLAASAPTR